MPTRIYQLDDSDVAYLLQLLEQAPESTKDMAQSLSDDLIHQNLHGPDDEEADHDPDPAP